MCGVRRVYRRLGYQCRRHASVGFGCSVGDPKRLSLSPADTGGDWFLGRRMLLSNTLCRGINAVSGLYRFDAPGEFGTARPAFFSFLLRRGGKCGLELITQARQFGQVGVIGEGLTEPCLIVTKLPFSDGEVLPDLIT